MNTFLMGIVAFIIASAASILRNFIDKKSSLYEQKEIEEAANSINEGKMNVLEMMGENVKELKGYYVISKNHARKSFSSSLFICFFGIAIYIFGICSYVLFNKDILLISVVSGTVVQTIAGLFFWLHKESTKQLSIYHKRLESTEKYLMMWVSKVIFSMTLI